MKLIHLPQLSFTLSIDDSISNKLVDSELFTKLTNKKKQIDHVQHKWDSAKKISNDYEYIYTSSNMRKNISSLIPVSRSFFKLREIIYDMQLSIPHTCGCIAEAPGGFIQSIHTFSKENNHKINDIFTITLIKDDKDIPYWKSSLLHNSSIHFCQGKDETGDIYKLCNVIDFIRFTGKNSCCLVTADGGFDYTKDFEQELSSYKLFYSEIMINLHIQQIGGTFICKLFDLFWYSTLQLIYILYLSYETISFIKPSTSRQSNSEKYIVCQGYKGYNKEINNIMTRYFGKDCLPIKLPIEFIDIIKSYHTLYVNYQINHIEATLQLITQRRNLDKPSQRQIKLAIEWCKKYKIPVNKNCYYL